MRKVMRRFIITATVGLFTIASGCQTWHPETGMTLPSPHYLDHPPQYIPDSPEFPLPNEVESLQRAAAANAAASGLLAPGLPPVP